MYVFNEMYKTICIFAVHVESSGPGIWGCSIYITHSLLKINLLCQIGYKLYTSICMNVVIDVSVMSFY